MSIFSWGYDRLFGGWKTWGPNAAPGFGAFATDSGSIYRHIGKNEAMKLSAFYACLKLRAETIGTFPVEILDNKNEVVTEHDLYSVFKYGPNKDMTWQEFASMFIVNTDLFGFHVSIPKRYRNGDLISLDPIQSDKVQIQLKDAQGDKYQFNINGDLYDPGDLLLQKSFSLDGKFGMPLLSVMSHVLSGQVSANDAAAINFRNGLAFGGFIKLPEGKRAFTPEQYKEFESRMDSYSTPEKRNKYIVMLPGMEPISGQQFKVSAADAELLNSRMFGIEEICRFIGVPPPLIGQTSKASSWASSLTALNQHLVTYCLQPTTTRAEKRFEKTLLSPTDRAKGLRVKFNMAALLRGDVDMRTKYYNTMQNLGNMSTNEVRELEDMPGIGPEGDVYRVSLATGAAGNENSTSEKPKDENQDD